jgi:hypothetical protein
MKAQKMRLMRQLTVLKQYVGAPTGAKFFGLYYLYYPSKFYRFALSFARLRPFSVPSNTNFQN